MNKKNTFFGNYIYLIGAVLLIGILMGTGYSYFKQALGFSGVASIGDSTSSETICGVLITKTYTFWTRGDSTIYNYSFKMTNQQDEPLYFWTAYFNIPDDATVTASGATVKIENGKAYLNSLSYNSFLDAGASVEFTATITTETEFTMENITVSNCDIKEEPEENTNVVANFGTGSRWGNYTYQFQITVSNEGTSDIRGWRIEVEVPSDTRILSLWNANYVLKDTTLTLTNLAYNGAIAVGRNTSFGIQMQTSNANYTPINIKTIGS